MKRGPFDGVTNIVRFNWPMYVSSLASVLILSLAARLSQGFVSYLFLLGAAGAAYLTVSSLLVSYYVYDYSRFYDWKWLPDIDPSNLVNIHSGFDESSAALAGRYPGAHLTILDFYDPKLHTEPSIRRARAFLPPQPGTVGCASGRLPLADASHDAAFLIFAAHEIRDHRERVGFFREVARINRGPVYVVEHTRDLANLLAFGPGFTHFHSPAEWRATFAEAGYRVSRERHFTLFVRIYRLERA